MATSTSKPRATIDEAACRLAFNIGQWVEGFLLDQALAIARKEAADRADAVVTARHIQTATLQSLPGELCRQIGVASDEQSGRLAA